MSKLHADQFKFTPDPTNLKEGLVDLKLTTTNLFGQAYGPTIRLQISRTSAMDTLDEFYAFKQTLEGILKVSLVVGPDKRTAKLQCGFPGTQEMVKSFGVFETYRKMMQQMLLSPRVNLDTLIDPEELAPGKAGRELLTSNISSMLVGIALMGEKRIAYQLPPLIYDQLVGKTDLSKVMDLPCSMIRFPHPNLYLNTGTTLGCMITETGPIFDSLGYPVPPHDRSIQFSSQDHSGFLCLSDDWTIGEALKHSIEYFKGTFLEGMNDIKSDKLPQYLEAINREVRIFTETANFIVAFSLFLMSTKDFLDEVIAPLSGKKHRNKPQYLKVPGLLRVVGGNFEAALKLHNAKADATWQGGTHASPRPHPRGGFFQRHWTGPKTAKQIPVVRFHHPCLVLGNVEEDMAIERTVKV